jgi:hypothetical protein
MVHINKGGRWLIQIKKLIWILAILPLMSFEKKKTQICVKTSFNSIVSVVSIKDLLECPREESTLAIKNLRKTKYDYFLDGSHSHHIRGIKHTNVTLAITKIALVKKISNSDSISHSDIQELEGLQKATSRVTYQKKANQGRDKLTYEIRDALAHLADYSAPDIIVTSTYRNWGGKGHRCGKAIDLNYSKTLTSWLMSESGEGWLNKYNLVFFIEDYKQSSKGMLSLDEEKHWRWVPWATGVHVHVNLK